MGNYLDFKKVKEIFGDNFIGPDEVKKVANLSKMKTIPSIPYSEECLNKFKNEYILIIGCSKDKYNKPLTINRMRYFYGLDPTLKEPCFYNQDWYLKEDFANKTTLENKWYLIKKTVVEKTRGKRPDEIIANLSKNENLPSAILTAYTFFAYYLLNNGKMLWKNDFIWCSDRDHNEDIIYTGRYIDPSGVNKNGFNIHRHLAIRPVYGLAPQII
jgi:hypothetical protein